MSTERIFGEHWSKYWYVFIRHHSLAIRIRLLNISNHRIDVSEMRFDKLGLNFGRVFQTSIHENDIDDIISNMSFSFNLKCKIKILYDISSDIQSFILHSGHISSKIMHFRSKNHGIIRQFRPYPLIKHYLGTTNPLCKYKNTFQKSV